MKKKIELNTTTLPIITFSFLLIIISLNKTKYIYSHLKYFSFALIISTYHLFYNQSTFFDYNQNDNHILYNVYQLLKNKRTLQDLQTCL